MRCISCNENNWENVDQYRVKPSGMSICKHCGFVSYPTKWKSKQEIFEHYRKGYRNPPTHQNFYTCQRKLHFHNAFLGDVFNKWKKEGNNNPEVFELGAAYGMALKYVKDSYPGANVGGTELTTSFRRNAFHEFGIKLSEEFDDTKKYDLIMSYKVAEHVMDIDIELKRHVACMKDDGYYYISVPTWFDAMNNFGCGGFDLEYYYDTNHINVWTEKLFENLLARVGLTIIKKDNVMYDSTYLCVKTKGSIQNNFDYENAEEIKERMNKIKQAFDLFNKNKFLDAIAVWPNYPQAHISYFEMNRKQSWESFSKNGWNWVKENLIDKAIKDCKGAGEIYAMACDIASRFEMYQEAIKYAEDGLKIKPGNPIYLLQLMNLMREMAIRQKTQEGKDHYFRQGREIAIYLGQVSEQYKKESFDYKYLFNSHLSFEGE